MRAFVTYITSKMKVICVKVKVIYAGCCSHLWRISRQKWKRFIQKWKWFILVVAGICDIYHIKSESDLFKSESDLCKSESEFCWLLREFVTYITSKMKVIYSKVKVIYSKVKVIYAGCCSHLWRISRQKWKARTQNRMFSEYIWDGSKMTNTKHKNKVLNEWKIVLSL